MANLPQQAPVQSTPQPQQANPQMDSEEEKKKAQAQADSSATSSVNPTAVGGVKTAPPLTPAATPPGSANVPPPTTKQPGTPIDASKPSTPPPSPVVKTASAPPPPVAQQPTAKPLDWSAVNKTINATPQAQAATQAPPAQSTGVASRRAAAPVAKGTGFTNIQKVMQASQGNKLGSTVVGGIQQAGQQAQQSMEQAKQQFQTEREKANINTEANAAVSADLIKNAVDGSELTANQLADAEKFRKGEYAGPMGLENAAALGMKAQSAEQLGQLSGSAGGRQGLLQQFVGGTQYGAGSQRLDSLLLGQNRQAINQARAATAGLAEQAARGIETSGAEAQAAAAKNQDFAQQFLGKAGGEQTTLSSAITADAQKFLDSQKAASTPEGILKAIQAKYHSGDDNRDTFDKWHGTGNRGDVNNQIKVGDAVLNASDRAALLAKHPEYASLVGSDLTSEQIAKGDISGVLGRTSAEAQGKTKGYNALNKLIGKGDDIKGGELAKAGTAEFNAAKLAEFGNEVTSGANKIAQDTGYTPEILNKMQKEMTDKDFRKAGGPAEQAAQQTLNWIRQGATNPDNSTVNRTVMVGGKSVDIAKLTPAQEKQYVKEQAKTMSGESSIGDPSRAAGAAGINMLQDQGSAEGSAYHDKLVKDASRKALLDLLK